MLSILVAGFGTAEEWQCHEAPESSAESIPVVITNQ